jgi:Kef-type K+ transport system membrane component KefB
MCSTALLVFLAIYIDVPSVRLSAARWTLGDPESLRVRHLMGRIHLDPRVRVIGSLPGRLLLVLIPLALLAIPLGQSFSELRQEIAYHQEQAHIRETVTDLWSHEFGKGSDGQARSYVGQITTRRDAEDLEIQLRVFTRQRIMPAEQATFAKLVASAWLLPEGGMLAHAFLGATLSTTSVGITARVLQDLDRSQSDEGRIILGAAVVDDIEGLLVLALVSGAAVAAGQAAPSYGSLAWLFAKALLFLVGSIVLGLWLVPRLFHVARLLVVPSVLLPLALIFCFTLAWLADRMGLAALIGAFAAGLILEEVHYEDLARQEEHELEDLLHPLTAFLAPVFFVVMGIRTDVRALGNWHTLGLAVSLVVVSILGKQACALGVLRRGVDRLAVAMGMMPRGEVMLIFAGVGLQLRVGDQPLLAPQTYTALILVLLVTTLLTAPALRWRLGPKQGSRTPSRPG